MPIKYNRVYIILGFDKVALMFQTVVDLLAGMGFDFGGFPS